MFQDILLYYSALLFGSCLLVAKKKEHVRDLIRPKDRSCEQYQFIIRTHYYGIRPNTRHGKSTIEPGIIESTYPHCSATVCNLKNIHLV